MRQRPHAPVTAALAALVGFAVVALAPDPAEAVFKPADLVCVSKNAVPETLAEGVNTDITYTVDIRNDGPDPATGVVITDILPADVDFVSSPDCNAPVAGVVTCPIGNLPAGGQASATINVNAPDPMVGDDLLNVASVSGNEADPNPDNNAGPQCEVAGSVTPGGCRVTGGVLDKDGNWNGISWAKGHYNLLNGTNRYQAGGQAGANTGAQPQPKGEWTHHQQRGPAGSFIFHAGTASAPPDTEIDVIVCSDPGFCNPARPAPNKQIDFAGVGSFKNIRNPSTPLSGVVPGVTLHWFEVHIEDLGEPGKNGKQPPAPPTCPVGGSAGLVASCACPDFYRITIHETADPGSAVIYMVEGYLDGGNLQIHPPTGFDLN